MRILVHFYAIFFGIFNDFSKISGTLQLEKSLNMLKKWLQEKEDTCENLL